MGWVPAATAAWVSWQNTTSITGTNIQYVAAPWNWTTTTASTITGNITWENWINIPMFSQNAVVETEQQRIERLERFEREQALRRAERLERVRRAEADYQAKRAKLEEAEVRALELLKFFLTEEQLKSFEAVGYFELRGRREDGSRGHRWRIRTGIGGNVDLLPDVGEIRDASYCAHLPYEDEKGLVIPKYDHMLAQKLALETNEDAYIAVANLAHRNAFPSQEIPSRFARRAEAQIGVAA